MTPLQIKQVAFAYAVGKLLLQAEKLQIALSIGEVWRTPEQAKKNAAAGKGIANSLHIKRLAIDINILTPNGRLDNAPVKYKLLADYWKTLHPNACWGGDFNTIKDYYHYSFEHEGIR